MWPSEELASRLYDLANWGLIAGLVIGVVSTIFLVWMGNAKEAHLQKRLADTNVIAALADEGAAEANRKAAALEVEALSLRLELLRRGPRENMLVDVTRDKLVAALKPFTGQSVEVRYGLDPMGYAQKVPLPTSQDVMGLADSLIEVFQDAKWSIFPAPSMSVLQGPDGISVQISDKASPATVAAAKELVKALRVVPFTTQGPLTTPLIGMPRQGTLRAFMPQVPGGPAVLTPIPEQTDETVVLSVLAHPK
jgi:hypothetical protein